MQTKKQKKIGNSRKYEIGSLPMAEKEQRFLNVKKKFFRKVSVISQCQKLFKTKISKTKVTRLPFFLRQ